MGWAILAPAVLFFAAAFVFVWLVLQPHLIYAAFGDFVDFPDFRPDWAFAAQRLSTAGGPVEYASDFLSQWFFYDWAGALIIAALAAAIMSATYFMVLAIARAHPRILHFAPAIIAVMLCESYNHMLESLLAILAAILFAAAYAFVSSTRTAVRLAVFAAMFVLLYWTACAAALVFALLAAINELLHKRRFAAVACPIFAVAAAHLIGIYFFLLEMPLPYIKLLPIFPLAGNLQTVSMAWLCLFVAAAPLSAAATARLFAPRPAEDRKPPVRDPKRKHPPKKEPRRPFRNLWFARLASLIVVAAAATCGAYYSFDSVRKHILAMNDLLRHERWNEFLDAARAFERMGFYNPQLNHDINRALYHAGRLPDEMFAWTQQPEALMLFGAEDAGGAQFIRMSDMNFDLGNVNAAEHWAYELLETEGPSPLVFDRLARINIAKGQLSAARVFLNALSADLIHGDRARQTLRMLETDPNLNSDPAIQNARAMNWKTDRLLNYRNGEQLLRDLLDQHPDNRMAFEYLMALYLMTHNQEMIVANLHRLDALGYKRIPRHYEEAVMIYYDKTRKPVNLHGRQISPETVARHNRFVEVLNRNRNDRRAAMAALAPEFGDSYFFYSVNVSGASR